MAPTSPRTGRIRSKDGAAQGVLGELPEEHRPVLVAARGPVPGGGVRGVGVPAARGAGPCRVRSRGDQEGLSGLKLPGSFS
ncbi:aminoglycoside adenylyltransferase domain-containing protein [Streptomyces narbonensis]|uniref:Aminoglycoside adenylyltransferase domain-containing protein n=1 Tax=Streptomyces narbonensis TaxID=67333 RepID=A0ABV3C562_9ACTN